MRAAVHALVALVVASASVAAVAASTLLERQSPRPGWTSEWPDTDFSLSTVRFTEILSGGPPKDGIPSIDQPTFHLVTEEGELDPQEPVVSLDYMGVSRAYPVRYLIWHEIVNDEIAGVPLVITYCPLCNSALVFVARLDGQDLEFGVSGKLRHSDLIMYDRQSETWWQQFLGEGIVGEHAGRKLEALPILLESWQSFLDRRPSGEVMSQPDLARRPYGSNPYVGYDTSAFPFLYRGESPPIGIDPLSRVVRVGDRAWLLERLRSEGEIVEEGVRLVWREGQASALDTREISAGRDVGNVVVTNAGNGEPLVHEVVFAFVFQAFVPEGIWMRGT